MDQQGQLREIGKGLQQVAADIAKLQEMIQRLRTDLEKLKPQALAENENKGSD